MKNQRGRGDSGKKWDRKECEHVPGDDDQGTWRGKEGVRDEKKEEVRERSLEA